MFTSSPAKPVLTFVYDILYYSWARSILSKELERSWHYISQRNDTFYAQFPKYNSYPLQKTCVLPMMSRLYTGFLKGICLCVTHWCVLVYVARVWHSAHHSWFCGTLECFVQRSRGVPNQAECMFGCNMTNPVQRHITTIFGMVSFNTREFATDSC